MSLDVYLTRPNLDEQAEAECKAAMAVLDKHGIDTSGILIKTQVFWRNITHNLNRMADALHVYDHCWRPEEIGIVRAEQLIEPLRAALNEIRNKPEAYRKFEPSNKWGTVETMTKFLEEYLAACEKYPTAAVDVSK